MAGLPPASPLQQATTTYKLTGSNCSTFMDIVLVPEYLMVECAAAGRAGLLHSNATIAVDAREMQALLDFRETLQVQDDVWPSNTNPCTGWLGVGCREGHVVSLSLSDMRHQATTVANGLVLLGSAVQALLKLPFLRSFNASGFLLQGGLPASFGELGQLNVLDLTATFLHGFIPAPLGHLTKLKFLSLAENNLTGSISPALDALYDLQHLNLSFNLFTGSLPSTLISSASHLVSLDLSHNSFRGSIPPPIGWLVNLQHLALGHNLLQGKLPLQHLNWTHLKYLEVSNNQLWGSISTAISHLKSLSYLNLEHNHLTGPIPSTISDCTRLQVLLLGHNMLNHTIPLPLTTLTNLVILSLSFNNLTGNLPSRIFTLPKLTSLELSHNLFFGSLFLQEGHPRKVQIFDISYNFLHGDIPRGFFSVESTAKNCFRGAFKQHSLKACWLFYSRNGLPWHDMLPKSILPNGSSISTQGAQGQAHRSKCLIAILGCATGGAFLLASAGACVLCRERYKKDLELEVKVQMGEAESERVSNLDEGSHAFNNFFLGEAFSLDTLHHATRGFSPSQMIANGQSGDFYKGTLDGGADVVVKRIHTAKMMELCLKEVEIFRKASHTRLITVLGYCMDAPDEKFLVYKYMPFGDLASALQTKGLPNEQDNCSQRTPLDWITRLKIAIGVAEGLAYLHHECSPPIVHRSLDQLDQDSDAVGQSKDVYDFGKLLLEIISGKCGISDKRDFQTDSWVEWAVSLITVHDKEALCQLLDPSLLVDEDFLDEVLTMARVAKACLNAKASKRPNMRYVLKVLENPQNLFQEEKSPGKISQIPSQQSWNTALFGAFRSASASPSFSISENLKEITSTPDRTQNPTFLVQNVSYINEIREHIQEDTM